MTVLAVAAFIVGITGSAYCIRRGITAWRGDDYRTRNDRAAAWRQLCDDPPTEIQAPGTNAEDLRTCRRIWTATETARKEKPQP